MLYKSHTGVYAILYVHSKLLLIKKARGPYTNKLDLPGGKPEPNETKVDTLKREVLEETGIIVKQATFFKNVFIRFFFESMGQQICFNHSGFIYHVTEYDATASFNGISSQDSAGADWYDISILEEKRLSPFAFEMVTWLLAQETVHR